MSGKYNITAKIFLVLSIVLFFSCQIQKLHYVPDDTYIYLKYSGNLANGNSFSFNPGEPSYGVTSPLWTAIIAPVNLFSLNDFWFAKFADLFFFTLSCLLLFSLSGHFFDKTLKYLGLSIFIINPWIIRSAFTGMETSFAIFFVTLLFYLYYNKKFTMLFILSGLLFMVRPELILLFVIFSGLIFIKNKTLGIQLKKAFLLTGLSIFIMILFWLFAHYTFGTIFPNTSSGKAVLSSNFGIIILQAKEILRIFTLVYPLEILFASIAVFFIFWRFKNIEYLPMFLWVIGLLLLYIITTASVMARYFLILYPVIIILCIKGIDIISVKKKFAAFIITTLFLIYSQYIYYEYVKSYCENFTRGVNECLIPIGNWLDVNTPENSRILVNDVGAIGYSTNRYIIDAAALINRNLEMNKKIMSVPNLEKEYPHLMLNFIETDYLIEKDTIKSDSVKFSYNYKLEAKAHFVFPQMWVLDPNPKYYTIYKVVK